jgi:riboflavin-specific deaminase-like protein
MTQGILVDMNMAMTADGKITSATREYPKFTSPHDRQTMDHLRAMADAVLIGAGTLRADDPPMHVRSPEMQELRRSLGKPAGLLKVLVSRSLKLSRQARFFNDPHTAGLIIATVDGADTSALEPLPKGAELWRLGPTDVDLARLLKKLEERGVRRLLVEGGAEMNWHFVAADLFDELHVTIAPALLGGNDAPTWLGGAGLSMAAHRRLELIEARVEGSEIFCHYKVIRAAKAPTAG